MPPRPVEPPQPPQQRQHYLLVDDAAGVARALRLILAASVVAFDSEGVDLGRKGPLTVASFKIMRPSHPEAFLFDIATLGGAGFAAIRRVLEAPSVRKVTYDVRADSDAVYHQGGRTAIQNLLDLQPLDQAVARHQGTYSHNIGGGRVRYVRSMTNCTNDHLCLPSNHWIAVVQRRTPPHRRRRDAWAARPLLHDDCLYAAADVHSIHLLHDAMSAKVPAGSLLMPMVERASRRYVTVFRDSPREITFNRNKATVMTDFPIDRA